MPALALKILSAGAAAFFGGLAIGWVVLDQPFPTSSRAVAATMRAELPKPGRISSPAEEPYADPAPRYAPRETAPEQPPAKISQPKPAEIRQPAAKPEPTKPAEATPAAPTSGATLKPAVDPEIFPTRRLKKLADRGKLKGLVAGLLDDEDDDD